MGMLLRAVGVALFLVAQAAEAQVHRCLDPATDRIVYSNLACPAGWDMTLIEKRKTFEQLDAERRAAVAGRQRFEREQAREQQADRDERAYLAQRNREQRAVIAQARNIGCEAAIRERKATKHVLSACMGSGYRIVQIAPQQAQHAPSRNALSEGPPALSASPAHSNRRKSSAEPPVHVGSMGKNCTGSGVVSHCWDDSGNSYSVQRLGNVTHLDGTNSQNGTNWSQTSQTIGNTTFHEGKASDGNRWDGTTTRFGNTTTTEGTDSRGNRFSKTCIGQQCF